MASSATTAVFRRCSIATKVPVVESPERMAAARRFAIEAASLAANTKCHNVVVLDVSGVSPVTDFFVIASGTSPRQMRTVCEEVEELGEPGGFKAISRAGYDGANWILTDFVDVVIHVFSQEARMFYDLDNLWADGKRLDWKSELEAAGKATATR